MTGVVITSVAHLIAASNNNPPLVLKLSAVRSVIKRPTRRAGAEPGHRDAFVITEDHKLIGIADDGGNLHSIWICTWISPTEVSRAGSNRLGTRDKPAANACVELIIANWFGFEVVVPKSVFKPFPSFPCRQRCQTPNPLREQQHDGICCRR